MATIIERGPRQWQAKIRRRGHPTQTRTFETKADAERWARKIESSMDDGQFIDLSEARRVTLGQLVSRYADEVNPTLRGAEKAKGHLNTMRDDPICEKIVATLTKRDFADYIRRMQSHGYANDTIIRRVNLFHRIFVIAESWGVNLPKNPVAGVEKPGADRGRNRRLAPEEEAILLERCDEANPYFRPLVLLALETAMRQGELLSLEWTQVHLPRRSIMLEVTKNGDAREVPLSSRAVDVLRNLPRSLDGRVFPLAQDAFKTRFRRLCAAAKLEGLRFHDLRHEATSRLFENTDLRDMEIAAITGHKTMAMLKRYAHLRSHKLAARLG